MIDSHKNLQFGFLDRSPGLRADLGYLSRVDIRKWNNYGEYRWRPKDSTFVSFGPNLSNYVTWDHAGHFLEWGVTPSFSFEMRRLTFLTAGHGESYETYQGIGFRTGFNHLVFSSEPYKWLAISGEFRQGSAINYYPGKELLPFMAKSLYTSAGFTLRPHPQLRIDESYMYTHLGSKDEWLPSNAPATTAAIFNDHILRSKANYQFSRTLSLRAIVDYHGVLPNPDLVALEKTKRVGVDFLLTYLVHPGTALYAGYSDGFENVNWNPALNPALQRRDFPGTSTGRQVFVKLSYLFRL
jgi:hypothetical protein